MVHKLASSSSQHPEPCRYRVLLAVFFVVAALGLSLDQLGKGWSFASWREPAGLREIIPGLFAGAQGRNYGGIYSLEGFGTPLIRGTLTLVGFVGVGMVVRWAIVLDRDRWRMIDAAAGGLLLAGILGNQVDRLFLGYVRDYLVLEVRPYEIFNTADLFMVLGALLLLGSLVLWRRPAPVISSFPTCRSSRSTPGPSGHHPAPGDGW